MKVIVFKKKSAWQKKKNGYVIHTKQYIYGKIYMVLRELSFIYYYLFFII